MTLRKLQLLLLAFEPFPLLLFGQSIAVTMICWLLAAFVGALLLFELMGGPNHMRFSTVLAATLLLSYGGGGLMALMGTIIVTGQADAVSAYGVAVEDLNIGMAAVCLSCLLLLCLGLLEKTLSLAPDADISEGRCLVIVAAALCTVSFAFLQGTMSYGGIVVESQRISPIASAAFILGPAGAAFSAYCMRRSKSTWAGALFMVALVAFLVLLLP